MSLVEKYSSQWPESFETIRRRLVRSIGITGYRIEHVGSTSVPGMVAKPIIDIDIIIGERDFPAIRDKLEPMGYCWEGDLGIKGREAFLIHDPEISDRVPRHHLYVCYEGEFELRKHLVFRNFLRAHKEWREKLSARKLELAERYDDDLEKYIEGKDAMVKRITNLAFAWDNQIGR